MRRFALLTLLTVGAVRLAAAREPSTPHVVLGIHGGLGPDRNEVSPAAERQSRADLEAALRAGYAVLQRPGGTSLDAVEAAIRVLEDSPLFNAGKGAVFTSDGRNELDASIMEGKTLRAGAVAGVTTVKNPITAARAVMDQTKHVLLIGPAADGFAKSAGLQIVEPAYFRTEERWQQHLKAVEKARQSPQGADRHDARAGHSWGTVGAVALDKMGNLAAGTSTGGTSEKRPGRVGDSPIIGAGTYADNASCAVSATGQGEFFIRYSVAHDIAALMKYKGKTVAAAAEEVILDKLKPVGGEGGVIALDAQGNLTAPYNSGGMFRGSITADGQVRIRLFDE